VRGGAVLERWYNKPMKNLNKGFVVPLLLGIIAVLVVGGGVYVYKKEKKVDVPVLGTETKSEVSSNDTSNWKTVSGTYKSTNYQVKLPADFKEKSVQASSEWHSKLFENSAYNFSILVEPIARLSLFSENLPPKTLAQVADVLKNRNSYGSVVAQKEIKVAGIQALLQDSYSLADTGGFVQLSTVLLSGDNFIVLTFSSKQNDWAKVKDAGFVRERLTQDFRDLNNQILSTFKFTK
jgi:hypothetical protein